MRHLFRQLDGRAARRLCAVSVYLWLLPMALYSNPAYSNEVRAVSATTQQSCRFVSPGRFLVDRVLALAGSRAERLIAGRLVDLPTRSRFSRTYGPLRQFLLIGGDRVSGEILHWEDDSIKLRLIGGQIVSIPNSAVEALHVPSGEVELLAERFEDDDALSGFIDQAARPNVTLDVQRAASGERSLKLSSESRPLNLICPAGLESARVQLWFYAQRSSSTATGGRFTFEFAESADAKSLVLELDGARMAEVGRQGLGDRWTTQAVELHSGWHCLTAILTPQRVLCLVDELLLASSTGIDAPLRTIRLTARGGLSLDDLTLSRLNGNATSLQVGVLAADDVVATHSGEELFGHVRQVTSRGVTLDGIAGRLALPWSRVASVGFRTVPDPLDRPDDSGAVGRETGMNSRKPTASPTGIVARIESPSLVDRTQIPPDRVTATILAITDRGLFVSHPLLGDLPLAWRDIRRIEPQFFGQDLLLEARRVHLGESIRADFQRPFPDGTEWQCPFVLTEIPVGEVWLSLRAVDLEPSGLETPPGSPFLQELRAGRLLTEVILNDHPVGDLNRLLRYRVSPEHPERLRCPLPRAAFRVGTNLLRLRQRSLTENCREFDDCELSNLRLELKSGSGSLLGAMTPITK